MPYDVVKGAFLGGRNLAGKKAGRGTQPVVYSPVWAAALGEAMDDYRRRTGKHLTQAEIGRRVGTSRGHVHLWLKGVRPSMRYFEALAATLGLSSEEKESLRAALLAPIPRASQEGVLAGTRPRHRRTDDPGEGPGDERKSS